MIFRYLVFRCFYFFIYLYVHNVRQKIPNVTVAQCFELVCKKIKGEFYCIIHIVIQFSVILTPLIGLLKKHGRLTIRSLQSIDVIPARK